MGRAQACVRGTQEDDVSRFGHRVWLSQWTVVVVGCLLFVGANLSRSVATMAETFPVEFVGVVWVNRGKQLKAYYLHIPLMLLDSAVTSIDKLISLAFSALR